MKRDRRWESIIPSIFQLLAAITKRIKRARKIGRRMKEEEEEEEEAAKVARNVEKNRR